jgi:hypothetical protein
VKTYNATRHDQRRSLASWEKYGIEFVPSPGANSNIPPQANEADIEHIARDTVERAVTCNAEAVLVGGITGLSILTAIIARRRGLEVVEPMVRGRDDNGEPIIVGIRKFGEWIDYCIGEGVFEGGDNGDA